MTGIAKRKPSLRITLMTLFWSLILLTVAALGFNAHRNARFAADDLAEQVLDQASRIVDAQVNDMLDSAHEQGRVNRGLLESGQFDGRDFAGLARYWREVMAAHRRLTRMSVAWEDTEEWSYVHRLADGSVGSGEFRLDLASGKLGLIERRGDGDVPIRRALADDDPTDRDPRHRPWYVEARRARRQVWSDVYLLIGAEGMADVPGVTCASPILAADGSIRGVVASTIDVVELCGFLRGVRVGDHGSAFLVERRDDGSMGVIAHPEPSVLIRPARGGRGRKELVPVAELADGRITSFLGRVPADLDPAKLRGMREVRFVQDGIPYLGAYRRLSTSETPDWLIGIILPEREVFARVDRSNRETALIGAAILAVATLVGLSISIRVARPLERLARETEAIGRLEVAARPVAHSIVREVDRLAEAVEETKTRLRSFGKYVPAELLRTLFATGQEAEPGGERRRLSLYFCDLADFTALAEVLAPEELALHLGEYFDRFSADILAGGGTVDKYIGDAIMAFWGAPAPLADHARLACAAALRNRASLVDLNRRWEAQGRPRVSARIGIHTGEVIVGNIGSPARLNYTVIGDPVNVASRLEGLNKLYGTDILIGDPTRREAGPALIARPVDWVRVKGRAEGLLIHEPLGLAGESPPDAEGLVDLAARALDHYRRRDWDAAIRLFEEADRLRPGDGPARVLLERCHAFRDRPPAEGWDGAHRMMTK